MEFPHIDRLRNACNFINFFGRGSEAVSKRISFGENGEKCTAHEVILGRTDECCGDDEIGELAVDVVSVESVNGEVDRWMVCVDDSPKIHVEYSDSTGKKMTTTFRILADGKGGAVGGVDV